MINGIRLTTKGKVAAIIMRAVDGRFTWEEATELIMELFDNELLNPPREK